MLASIQCIDIFALTFGSRALWNGLLEAMAAGVPIVASDCGELRKYWANLGISSEVMNRLASVLLP